MAMPFTSTEPSLDWESYSKQFALSDWLVESFESAAGGSAALHRWYLGSTWVRFIENWTAIAQRARGAITKNKDTKELAVQILRNNVA